MKLSHFLGVMLFALIVSGGISATAENSPQDNTEKSPPVATEVPVGLISVVVVGSVLIVGAMAVFGNKWDDALEENPTDVWENLAENESASNPSTENSGINDAIAENDSSSQDESFGQG